MCKYSYLKYDAVIISNVLRAVLQRTLIRCHKNMQQTDKRTTLPRTMISEKLLLCNCIEIISLRVHSPANSRYTLTTLLKRNTYEELLLMYFQYTHCKYCKPTCYVTQVSRILQTQYSLLAQIVSRR